MNVYLGLKGAIPSLSIIAIKLYVSFQEIVRRLGDNQKGQSKLQFSCVIRGDSKQNKSAVIQRFTKI